MTNLDLKELTLDLASLSGIELHEDNGNFWRELNGLMTPFTPFTNWNDIMPIAVDLGVKLDPRSSIPKLGWIAICGDVSKVDKNPQIALTKCCIAVLQSRL